MTWIGFLLYEDKLQVAASVYKQVAGGGRNIFTFLVSNSNIQKNWEKQPVQLKPDIGNPKSIFGALKLSTSTIFTRN